ncbi:unnamed protein product [Boreogadus saida]
MRDEICHIFSEKQLWHAFTQQRQPSTGDSVDINYDAAAESWDGWSLSAGYRAKTEEGVSQMFPPSEAQGKTI